eukprot:TRINITY_DN67907_c2_g2_i1.p2 TRINITY_DN67907_c2_g2~~TRINITY_DN67907_c2_g2_i1.p2  ORF type:complete len:121 (+),score=12.96 TRINITY_DN67907_c2_g2_i1:31-393(+)
MSNLEKFSNAGVTVRLIAHWSIDQATDWLGRNAIATPLLPVLLDHSPNLNSFVNFNMREPEQPRPTEGKVMQLGGDFLVTAQGELVFEYRSKEGPRDRATAEQLLAAAGQYNARCTTAAN